MGDDNPVKPPVAVPTKIGTLYVDCLPVGLPVVHLSTLVSEANTLICTGEADYRLEPDLGYGRAAGAMSAMVSRILPDGVDVVCSTRQPEHRDCLSMLEGCAAQIVRGV